METYTILREFADSWMLLALTGFFVSVCIWAYLPSQSAARAEASAIPFRDERRGCDQDCETCVCRTDFLKETDHV